MMRICTAVVLVVSLFSRNTSAWFWPFATEEAVAFAHESVTKLSDDNFEDRVVNEEDERFYFIKFYAPWCGHCKTLAPIWAQLASENQDKSVEFAHVDCDANRKLCKKAAVRGYPEIKIFHKGRVGLSMRGGKDLEGMRVFVRDAIPTVKDNHIKAMQQEAKEALEKTFKEAAGSVQPQEL